MTNEGFKFQASVKDTDGDMVNVRADSAAELESALLDFPTGAYAQFKANVRGGSSLGAIVAPQQSAPPAQQQAPAQAGWGQQAPQQAAPQQQATVPRVQLHPEGKTCSCGRTLEYKDVTRKTDGKSFQFWACPAQQKRDDGHHSEFAN